MDRPQLLLDVDGVLAPFGGEPPSEYKPFYIASEDWIYLSLENAYRISRLKQYFDIVWATAWEDAVDILMAPHAILPPIPMIRFDHSLEESTGVPLLGVKKIDGFSSMASFVQSWKLPWIQQWAEINECPILWIDDDAMSDAHMWAEERSDSIPTKIISTQSHIGMTDDHIQEAVEWAKSIQ